MADLDAARGVRLIEGHAAGISGSHALPMWIWLRARRVSLPARCRLTDALLAVEPRERGDDDREEEEEEEEAAASGVTDVPRSAVWITSVPTNGNGSGSWSPSTGAGRTVAVLYPQLVEEIVHRAMLGFPLHGTLPSQQQQQQQQQQQLPITASPAETGVRVWEAIHPSSQQQQPPSQQQPSQQRQQAAVSLRTREVVPAQDVLRIIAHPLVFPWWSFARSVPLFFPQSPSGPLALPDERTFANSVEAMFRGFPSSNDGRSWTGDGDATAASSWFDRDAAIAGLIEAYSVAYSQRGCSVPPRYCQDVATHHALTGQVPTKPPLMWPEAFKRFWTAYRRVHQLALEALRAGVEQRPISVFANPDAL